LILEIHRTYIRSSRTAQVFSIGASGEAVEDLWIVLHGYGQLGAFFIRNFDSLLDGKTRVVAPEALSRFYLDGFSGRIGASWMTKEDRLNEIRDQAEYLDRVLEAEHIHLSTDSLRLHVLGFSQGTATAWRWVRDRPLRPASYTIWAGQAPAEFSDDMDRRLSAIPVFQVVGKRDPFITAEQADMQEALLRTHFPKLQSLQFDGKHEIHSSALMEIRERIADSQKG
jgi:predicted esterase